MFVGVDDISEFDYSEWSHDFRLEILSHALHIAAVKSGETLMVPIEFGDCEEPADFLEIIEKQADAEMILECCADLKNDGKACEGLRLQHVLYFCAGVLGYLTESEEVLTEEEF